MKVISRADPKKAGNDSNSGNDCHGVEEARHFFFQKDPTNNNDKNC
jgi:hypothetical protein